jgi:hypothetical protein
MGQTSGFEVPKFWAPKNPESVSVKKSDVIAVQGLSFRVVKKVYRSNSPSF